MLDIGFWELILIAILALVVLGPERLPGAIRSVVSTFRSIKQTANNLKAEFNHELRVNELHEQLKQAEQKGMMNLTESEKKAVSELEQAAHDVNQIKNNLNSDNKSNQ
ncbi:Sec-independent protein translocase protein TatB [Catenovulum sediminis]|uniref:Sec-independent protein translocase protein TatB n=1 Tax=Catenovulum sediminis TaxID=1740262 RepID=A0ABV1RFZ2_9ALTE|nr:Sec-independent protein translocase protein TatB [Catenovulum sediminis]